MARAHGVRGAVRLICSPQHAAFLASHPDVVVGEDEDDERIETAVLDVAGTDDAPIVQLAGITTREQADRLRGRPVRALRTAFPAGDEDEFFIADLEGCAVVDGSGRSIGVVSRVEMPPANAVLVVERPSAADLLVPFVREAVPMVDLAERRLEINLELLGE